MAFALSAVSISAQTTSSPQTTILFEGARVIVDTRRPPIENAALLIDQGHIVQIGKKGQVRAPAGAALIDSHVHLGYQKGLSYAAGNFTRENLIDQLNRYAYAGVSAVMSLGTDPGDLPFKLRAEQDFGLLGGALYLTAGRGFAAPDAGPGSPAMKASAYGITTEEQARQGVREQISRNVAFVKIWVDDRNGMVPKLSPALYRGIIDEAHMQGTRVIAHVYYLEDAKDLVRSGIDAFAHLVRDREMDAEVIALIKQRKVLVMPNLSLAQSRTPAEVPAWLDDSLFKETTPAAVIDRVRAFYAHRPAEAIEAARKTYGNMQSSLARD